MTRPSPADYAGVHYDTWQHALDADWRIVREALEINLFGSWRMAQAFAPPMREAGWGRIVNVRPVSMTKPQSR